jgi:hypothetical protein
MYSIGNSFDLGRNCTVGFSSISSEYNIRLFRNWIDSRSNSSNKRRRLMKHLKEIGLVVGVVVSYTAGAVLTYCISDDSNRGIAMLGGAILGHGLFVGVGTVVERIREWWIGRGKK